MAERFSMAGFVEYGNGAFNNVSGKTPNMELAFKKDIKKAILQAGCPTKDEINVIDDMKDIDMSNTLAQIPELVAGYVAEGKSFQLPAVNDKLTTGTISVVSVEDQTKEREFQFGEKKGEKYTSITKAHNEFKIKNNRSNFKESK